MVTGANGHLGRRLATASADSHEVIAAVRSERARKVLLDAVDPGKSTVRIVDYGDADSLTAAAQGCDAIVHLVGIIKETSNNSYQRAHERASQALAQAAATAGVGKILYVSILGSAIESTNACFASKGRAERALLDGPVPALVIRVPMVLGEDDYASLALRKKALRAVTFEFRADSLEQPIYAGDVAAALLAALEAETGSEIIELAGPESLPRRELIRRAGRIVGHRPRIIDLPRGAGVVMAWLMETILPDPPVTRAMLGVLDHDDEIDPAPACERLGIGLTPLDEMLRRTLS